jgi:hypothetical protein
MWHSIPPWIRGAFISFALMLVLFIVNGIGLSIFSGTGFAPALICYSEQLVFYAINGMLAGWQADETRALQVRRVGHRGEKVRLNLANYLGIGALAGLVLALLAAIAYLITDWALAFIMPGMQILTLIGMAGPFWMIIVVDILAAMSVGAIGGIIYERMFAAPGRR